MESLWGVVDDYLQTELLARLGAADSLPVQAVYVWAQTDPSEWTSLPTPFLVIMSYQSRAVPAGHDGGPPKREQEYLVTVLSVVEGTSAVATQNAKILAHRVEKTLASLPYGLEAADGSRASRPRRGTNGALFTTRVELYPRPSQQPNQKYGVAVTAFTVPGITV